MAEQMEEELKGLTENDEKKDENHQLTGNITIIMERPFHLSLGPNYGQFSFGFCLMLLIVIIIMSIIHFKLEEGLQKTVGKILSLTSIIFYLLTAFCNPGLYDPVENIETKTRYCHTCMHFKPKNVIHCISCDTCIEGYDHHCPWISKCVGKKNILYFYGFMASLTLFGLYSWVLIYELIMGKLNY